MTRVVLRRPFAVRRPRRWWVLALGLALIPAWQMQYRRPKAEIPRDYIMGAAVGMLQQQPFVYFYHYLGLFPLASAYAPLPMSKDGARTIIDSKGSTLVMEGDSPAFSFLRNGDHGRIWLFLPDVWLKGAPTDPSAVPANSAAFIASLMALFSSFWWIGLPVVGGVLVLFLGGNPFQVFEAHVYGNIFGWPITTALFVLALMLPLLDHHRRPGRFAVLLPLFAGILLGLVRHIRSEALPIALSALLTTMFVVGVSWRRRALYAGALLGALLVTTIGVSAYFRAAIRKTHALVATKGGFPHPGAERPIMNHAFWFPMWTGLGDFDTKYGYAWSDLAAHDYVRKVLPTKYGVTMPPGWRSGAYVIDGRFIDSRRRYPLMPYELPSYGEAIRDKVLHDISHDPVWYAGILARRVWQVATQNTPLALSIGDFTIGRLRLPGLILVPVWLLVALARSRLLARLCLFTLPLCAPAILVFSKMGMTYYAIYHLVAAAVVASVPLQTTLWWWKRRKRRRPR